MGKLLTGRLNLPPHEERHHTTKAEFVLTVLIIFSIIASLTTKIAHFPLYVVPILVALFLVLKIFHIVKKGGTLLEDYASVGAIAIFLVLYTLLKGEVHIALVMVFIVVLLYSTGLTLWIKSQFKSRQITHFLISYLFTIVIVILLFAGAYSSRSDEFLVMNQQANLGFADSLYFSTMTFTTVGYGDIVPLGINKILASIQAIIGITVNIALIGYILAYGRHAVSEQ